LKILKKKPLITETFVILARKIALYYQFISSMKKFIFLICLIGFLSNSCDKNSRVVVFKKKITFVVSGTANDYLINYVDEYGNYKQTGSVAKWEYEFKAKPEKYLYLSAINNTGEGNVKVEIFQGNKLFLTDFNEVPYGTAVVTGFVE
jgi:hypothetical protein